MRNVDVIRRLSVEQLADFLERFEFGDIDYARTFCDLCEGKMECVDCLKWWLEEDAKDHPQGLQHYDGMAYDIDE